MITKKSEKWLILENSLATNLLELILVTLAMTEKQMKTKVMRRKRKIKGTRRTSLRIPI